MALRYRYLPKVWCEEIWFNSYGPPINHSHQNVGSFKTVFEASTVTRLTHITCISSVLHTYISIGLQHCLIKDRS